MPETTQESAGAAPPTSEGIAVIGLGYVGLPVALAMARQYPTVGFDTDATRIRELRAGRDSTQEISAHLLEDSRLRYTTREEDLKGCTFFIVAVPTPIDKNLRPDLRPLCAASRTVGRALSQGSVVVYESTVYPGATEDVCGPLLAQTSGLECGVDFWLGYSPERMNPGDQEHTFERITKVVAGQNEETLARVASVYEKVVPAGVYRAPSLKVAEAAKVIENTQRDLNVALMNELAIIFHRLGIRTCDVLETAATKWNFLRFTPGLVGGHCIGVDPYYLTSKAEELGYQPEVILAGRRINNSMGAFVAQQTLELLAQNNISPRSARVAVLGLTFKENVPDLRNSRVPTILSELATAGQGLSPLVHDPFGSPQIAHQEYGISLCAWSDLRELDAVILAVPHRDYLAQRDELFAKMNPGGVVLDVKSALSLPLPRNLRYWSL